MGYILPVTHYTYKNYQTRMKRGDDRPFYIEKAFPVILEKQGATANLASKMYVPVKSNKRKKGEKRKEQTKISKLMKQSELTGKGKMINKQV